jgi:phenylacetaldehyde dehydrogenase
MSKIFSIENPLDFVSGETRAFLKREHQQFIGGKWTGGTTGSRRNILDPATGKVLSTAAHGTKSDVDVAVAAAREAFENGPWRTMGTNERAEILWRVGELIGKYAVQLAELDTLNEGSPYGVVKNFYVKLAADHFRYFSGWANKLEGTTLPVNIPGEWLAYTTREPVGVVGQILPWNVPLLMAAWKLAPALAAGCTVIIKPAEDTPLSALMLAEICEEAGVPPGVVSVITGDGSTGSALVDHHGIDKIGFTGSTATGKAIVRAAAGNLKRVSLELGGKSPVFVFPDADLERAIPGVAEAAFLNSGQACTAGSRLYIHEDIYDKVIEGVARYAEGLKLGHGLDASTHIGPLISERQFGRVSNLLQAGLSEGANLVTGGQRGGEGYFVKPTLLTNVTPEMTVYREEIFGPVISAMKITSHNVDALAKEANNSTYGLAASIWTKDINLAHRLAARIRAGVIWINNHNQSDANMPWGGFGQSGWGREMGRPAIELYTEVKSVAVYLS